MNIIERNAYAISALQKLQDTFPDKGIQLEAFRFSGLACPIVDRTKGGALTGKASVTLDVTLSVEIESLSPPKSNVTETTDRSE